MARITVELLRRRAEHNDGCLDTLQEVSLHQQHLERIEVLNQACRHLKMLYLQNNVIPRIENLNRLKELEYLNLAVNNITRVENLGGCESLRRLDLTLNFIALPALPSLAALGENRHLRELCLVGNPCTKWPHYRLYVIALLPQLRVLDREGVTPSERIAAQQKWPTLCAELLREVGSQESSDFGGGQHQEEAGVPVETGYTDESGELKRPWCPATRLLEHREQEQEAARAEARRRAGQGGPPGREGPPLRDRLPPLPEEGAPVYQKNEGKWEFSFSESADGRCVVLEVALGRHLDMSLVEADVQPGLVRLLAKGRLLQLRLPEEVRPDGSSASRSRITGALVLVMPKAVGEAVAGAGPVVYEAAAAAAAAEPGVRTPSARRAPPPSLDSVLRQQQIHQQQRAAQPRRAADGCQGQCSVASLAADEELPPLMAA